MNITKNQKNEIRMLFKKMNSKDDFLNLLNFTKTIIYKEKTHPFTLNQLNYYINKDSNRKSLMEQLNEGDKRFEKSKRNCYKSFEIKKKSGGVRVIHTPVKGLKEFQKVLNIILQTIHIPHKAATGFVKNKSIVENASFHIQKNYVFNIDLKDFFPSIEKSRVWGRLLVAPFELGLTQERRKIANMIATLSCTPMEVEAFQNENSDLCLKSVLPQGAPTSPTLTNIICERLDIKLTGLAKRFGLTYSRYADDITFSSMHNEWKENGNVFKIYNQNSPFTKELIRIITEQGFQINFKKVRLQKKAYKQEVTGLIVNEKVNISKKYIKQLRMWLYYLENYDFDKVDLIFQKRYFDEKQNAAKKVNMLLVLEGKLLYLKMVKNNEAVYIKLKSRFDKIIERNNKKSDNIVDLIFEVGLDKAMEQFNI